MLTNRNLTIKALGATCLLAMSSVSQAAITEFSDDFQGYGSAAFFTPWEGFSDNCGFPGGYSFSPSTTGPQITALASDGPNSFLNMYANYDNATCQQGFGPNPVENISVFRNFAYDASDTASGNTVLFDFDYREAVGFGPSGATEVGAFIRVFDGAFNLLATDVLDTSGSTDWQSGQLSITLDSAWTEGFFQVGFNNAVTNYENSGMNYDNASLSIVPIPAAVWLFGSGLGLLGFMRRRSQQS
jgi:hypothetical protein